jgi:imidazolonepropionase-like amidohydrolase
MFDASQIQIPVFNGASVHAGIPPLKVLRIATQHSPSAVGAGDVLGTLEAGTLADIVLLDANPLENIENTLAIWRVIVGGKVS